MVLENILEIGKEWWNEKKVEDGAERIKRLKFRKNYKVAISKHTTSGFFKIK